MLTKGVYTTQCPTCKRSIVMHVLSDDSIGQKKCVECETEFERLDKGEERNSFVIVPKAKKVEVFVNKEAVETKRIDENFSATSRLTKKDRRKFF